MADAVETTKEPLILFQRTCTDKCINLREFPVMLYKFPDTRRKKLPKLDYQKRAQ